MWRSPDAGTQPIAPNLALVAHAQSSGGVGANPPRIRRAGGSPPTQGKHGATKPRPYRSRPRVQLLTKSALVAHAQSPGGRGGAAPTHPKGGGRPPQGKHSAAKPRSCRPRPLVQLLTKSALVAHAQSPGGVGAQPPRIRRVGGRPPQGKHVATKSRPYRSRPGQAGVDVAIHRHRSRQGSRGYREKSGLRFSRKALRPSLPSSVM